MNTKTAEDRQQYKNVKNGAERVKRIAKQIRWKQIGTDFENDLHGTKKLL